MRRPSAITLSLAAVGERTTDLLEGFGRFWTFAARAIAYVPIELGSVRGWRRLLPQCFIIGTGSVPVIMLTGMFIGMVLIVQGWEQFDAAGLSYLLGGIVNISIASELGPVLAGVMLAGRVGGALTAELGTMNVTEQLLALRSMGADPLRHLVAPRFLACLLLTPLLTAYADLVGAIGAWLVFVTYFGGQSAPYWDYTRLMVELWHLGSGLAKAFFFGGLIGLVSCYKGFHCKPGAQGVGEACTESFVVSFILILMMDFFLNIVLNTLYNALYGFRSLIM
ncbi:MAG: ABC transporter permease [Phycisphaerales bacterium]|nr:ABC transporter permease [Phycisphaerales bacterium]